MNINLNELNKNGYSNSNIANCFDDSIQELILLPTEKCNFRCTYCYEDFEIGKMKPWLVKAIIKYIEKRVNDIKHLHLSWFGGEPFLAKNICMEIIEKAHSFCKSKNVTFHGGFTTNGYLLTNELVSDLSKLNHANFQITLDGSIDGHNKTRILANGKGTFNKIWSNITSLKNSNIEFNIKLRLHISNQNYSSMKTLIEHISKVIGHDERFSVHFHKISNLGGPNTSKIKVVEPKKYNDIISEFQQILKLDFNSEISLHKNRHICYAAKPNSLLVRADGRIGKCTVAFDNPKNTLGKFNKDGTISIDNEKLKPWMAGFDTGNPKTLSCPVTALDNEKQDLKVEII